MECPSTNSQHKKPNLQNLQKFTENLQKVSLGLHLLHVPHKALQANFLILHGYYRHISQLHCFHRIVESFLTSETQAKKQRAGLDISVLHSITPFGKFCCLSFSKKQSCQLTKCLQGPPLWGKYHLTHKSDVANKTRK